MQTTIRKETSYGVSDYTGIDSLMKEENCPLCELFLAEAEDGRVSRKDAELFSGHIDANEHEVIADMRS